MISRAQRGVAFGSLVLLLLVGSWFWLGQRTQADPTIAIILTEHTSFPDRLTLEAGRSYRLVFTGPGPMGALSYHGLNLRVNPVPNRFVDVRLKPKQAGQYIPAPGAPGPVIEVVEAGTPALNHEIAVVLRGRDYVPNAFSVPAGEPIRIGVWSTEGERTFAIAGTEVQIRARPDGLETVSLAAPLTGEFFFGCADCDRAGIGRIKVVSAEDFAQAPAQNQGDLEPAPVVGRRAPDFAVLDLNQNPLRLSDLRGQVVVLNFWATWCPPCREEMPALDQYYRQNREKGVVVVGMNVAESKTAVERFIRESGVVFPIGLDPDRVVETAYRVSALPSTFIIDEQGFVRMRVLGPLDVKAIGQMVAQARQAGGS